MIPLLVCDDSNMARKQLIRALPADWPVSISQAANGQEALTLIRQGQARVMLLDLTMPVLDGYQTLAALQAEGLSCQVIVVSGDVQEEAVRRALQLGALAFLRKPADPAELHRTLAELGLLTPSEPTPAPATTSAPELPELKVSFRDALREVSNVAMGRAGALLARALGVFVQLPIPQVNIFEVGELHMTLLEAQRGEQFSAICQGFIGEAIAGEALLLFHDSQLQDMARLLGIQPHDNTQNAEMLLDLASILIGACLSGIAEQLDLRFSQGHPQLLGQHACLEQLIRVNSRRWRKTLAVEISYSLEGHAIHFDLLLLFTEDSIRRLTAKIGYLME
ncbi:response regulator [Pseudomonas sp. NCCP-436]|uniref:response regulator n=1 Tax=Pseudomonas sp. NCCP-436 TaxID=2842481 RepID=UPI001C7E8F59|nr:response regulator [Pseudomonas sp. NCCP-436]